MFIAGLKILRVVLKSMDVVDRLSSSLSHKTQRTLGSLISPLKVVHTLVKVVDWRTRVLSLFPGFDDRGSKRCLSQTDV